MSLSSATLAAAPGFTAPNRRRFCISNPISRWFVLALIAEDSLMFSVAAYAATVVVFRRPDAPLSKPGELFSVAVFVLLWLGIFAALGLYRRSFALSARDELYHAIGALVLGIIPQMVLFTAWPAISTSRQVLLFALVFAIVLVGGVRVLEHMRRSAYLRRHPRNIALVGPQKQVMETAAAFGERADTILHHIVVSTMSSDTVDIREAPVAWYEQARHQKCDLIVLTEMLSLPELLSVLERAAAERVAIALAPMELRAHGANLRLERHGTQMLLVTAPISVQTRAAGGVKRGLDIIISTGVLGVLAPFFIVVALLVWISSGSPIVYRQRRVGKSGKVFQMLKFRTMRGDAELQDGAVLARRGDARLTTVGRYLRRFSIDETLQLINVLRGEMSLVGPRPERPEFVAQYMASIPRYAERHSVRPGITGWSQIHLPRILDSSDTAEKLECDLFYIENWSIFVDMSIIIKTAFEFIFHRTI